MQISRPSQIWNYKGPIIPCAVTALAADDPAKKNLLKSCLQFDGAAQRPLWGQERKGIIYTFHVEIQPKPYIYKAWTQQIQNLIDPKPSPPNHLPWTPNAKLYKS